MKTTTGKLTRRGLLRLAWSRHTRLALDAERCTGCGACAGACAPGALSFTGGDTHRQLAFASCLCTGCGRCGEACPEDCLGLSLVPGKPPEARVLAEVEMALCPECGAPVGAAAVIARLRSRLAGMPFTGELDKCPDCRAKHLRVSKC